MHTFADKVIEFNENLDPDIRLPDGIKIMNPFIENPEALKISSQFYRRYYNDFYINSPCPLGFVKINEKGKEVNYNYYDSSELLRAIYPFLIISIRKHISMGINTDVAFCLGAGKNHKILSRINNEHNFFGRLIPLEHPRYIMQYKSGQKPGYIEKYLKALNS